MKLTQQEINVWIDAVSKPSTAKNYKARISKILKDREDIVKDIVDMTILIDIVDIYTSPSTIKGIVQVFLKLINEYPGFKISDKAKKSYNDVFLEANSEMSQVYIQRSMDETTESFTSIKNKVFEEYPEGSDERLYMQLYELCPTRDDLGAIYIVKTVRDTKNKSKDYLIISTKTLQINTYKTDFKYGPFECKIPVNIWKQIDLTKEKLFNHGENLSSWVGKMLKSVGVPGRINTLRHGFLSEKLEGDAIKDPQVRKQLAASMKHSAQTQLLYLRDIEK